MRAKKSRKLDWPVYFDHPERKSMNMSKAAEILGVTVSSVRRWVKSGELELIRSYGNYGVYVSIDSVKRKWSRLN